MAFWKPSKERASGRKTESSVGKAADRSGKMMMKSGPMD